MSNWVIYNKKCDEKKISEDFNISPLLVRILNNRNINTYEDIKMILSNNLSDIHDEKNLPNIDMAAKIIIDKIKNNKKIRIIGDYDIDGVCSTYILYDAIKKFGGNISYYIPDRVTDGYGVNINIIDECIKDGVDTILTCDNGIAAINEIKYAKDNNLTVVVTDHHEAGEILPNADCIVNPKLRNSIYPFKEICGAVVVWKFIRYLKSILVKNYDTANDFTYIEFATLATVGDIMPIINENHIIVKLGLQYIKNTKNRGLYQLLKITDMINKNLSTYHIGYIIGPLINAAGRLESAKLALDLFLSEDDKIINDIASKLKLLNDDRKKITEDGVKLAIDLIDKKYKDDKVLLVYLQNVNESICGIIAGRIKELYNKPTIVFSDTIDEGILKGSGRSIDAYNMYEELYKYKNMYEKFGGHKGAAGLSIKQTYLSDLRKNLNDICNLKEEDFNKKIYVDAEIMVYNITANVINDIAKIEPYGHKFDSPILGCRNVECIVDKVFGEKNNVLKMTLSKDNKKTRGIYFYNYDVFLKNKTEDNVYNIIYNPKINEFNGYQNVEINILEMKGKKNIEK